MSALIDKLRILVIDDSSMILELVASMLISAGFREVEKVADLRAALSRVESLDNKYDLIILDGYLGEESGLEVLKALRHHRKEVPVIMLTQEKDGGKVIEAITDGASDYVVKPFSEDVLISKVRKALNLI
jgi:DNA-binding response OmpR family regulator